MNINLSPISPLLTRADRRMNSRVGFTLVEILVVVAVIAILISITIVSLGLVGNKMKGNATRQTMNGLKSMFAEAEQAGLMKPARQPQGMFENNTDWRARTDLVTNQAPDFWRRPNVSTAAAMPAPALQLELEVINPTDATTDWRHSMALRNTALALTLLRTVPSVARTLDALPAGTVKSASLWDSGKAYPAGVRVLYASNPDTSSTSPPNAPRTTNGFQVFISRQPVTAGTAPTPASDTANWGIDYAAALDAWTRPIIYVPASGLAVTTGGSAFTVKSPDGKGFWASAGADGRLDLGDDNLYSFEN